MNNFNECEKLLWELARSAKIVSTSLNSGDYIPELRYKNMETAIKNARKHLHKIANQEDK